MPRRASRAAPASPEAPAPAPGASKRRASARLSASEAEVKRVKSNRDLKDSVKTTAERSKYFEPESSAESDLDSSDAAGEDSGSAYDEQEAERSPTPDSQPDDASDNEEASTRPRAKGKQSRTGPESAGKNKELWREGVRTGLGPGKEVFIPKPKARDAGNVPYVDEKLHPNTKLFLLDLAENNDREWFKAHDPDYRAAKKDFETFVDTLTPKIIDKDATVPELPVKDLVFRIHRDTRFSKNPLPYKIHMSAAWSVLWRWSGRRLLMGSRSRTGKKGPYAAYYVHFQPGASFVGCGLWHPEADPLATLRDDIVEHADQWKEVLRSPEIRREFLKGASDDDDAVVKAFAHSNRESALKTKPRGYDANHQEIELLRLRSFTLGRALADDEILAEDAQERILALVASMEPFVTYLNSVVMPDQ
ncbi:hypothetical protein N7512_004626 [Penicillium capsulatum]|nr:hypothetical protein N7512_004626 [Penicillium capsulatum]